MAEQRPVTAQFRVVINGFAADMEASGTLEDLVGLTRKLQALEIEPGNSPLLWKGEGKQATNTNTGNGGGNVPVCPVHRSAMKPSSKGGGYFCPRKNADGSYCSEKA